MGIRGFTGFGGGATGLSQTSPGDPESGITATGGTTHTPGNGYKYHVFSYPNSDNFVVSALIPGAPGLVDVLLVGGGGSGGTFHSARAGGGGGGGAGGVIHMQDVPLSAATYPVSIGDGGAGIADSYNTNGNPGDDSTLTHPSGAVTAYGGGGGGASGNPFADPASGSGAGAGSDRNTPPSGESYTGDTAQKGSVPTPLTPLSTTYGNPGGNAYANPPYSEGGSQNGGGGGGGAGSAGTNAAPPATYGEGGDGQPFPAFAYPLVGLSPLDPYSPTTDHYGGGGAAGNNPGANGGAGGGGPNGGGPTNPSVAGVDNLGGGAGAQRYPQKSVAVPGGSGILIVRYLD